MGEGGGRQDIAGICRQAVRWGAAAPSFQLPPPQQCKIKAQRETTSKCGLCTSSLATRLRIDGDNAVRQADCSSRLWYVNLCMELQCMLLQLAGR